MRLFQATVASIMALGAAAQSPSPTPTPSTQGVLAVFVDCSSCEGDTQQYLRAQLTYLDFVRSRQDSSVHALVTTQSTGSGGREWSVAFLGQREFAGIEDTLKFATEPSDTEEKTRSALLRTLQIGFARYIARTGEASKISVAFAGAPKSRTAEKKDRWNSWVMSVQGEASVNGEESRGSVYWYTSVGADRITEKWKITTGINYFRETSHFTLSEGEIESTRSDRGASTTIVRSFGEHWSVGGFGNISASTYSNIALKWNISPAIEFNVFPYSQSTRRQLRFLYRVGPQFARYEEVTTFDKTKETLGQQALDITLDQKTKWGTTRLSLKGQSHLHDLGSNSLSLSAELNWRLVRGLSLRTYGAYSRVRDQRSLPRQAATDEEILLRISQLQSGYEYWVNFGISYSFGATTNNVVNPRFGR